MTKEEDKSESAMTAGHTKPEEVPALLAQISDFITGSEPYGTEAGEPKTSSELATQRTNLAVKRTLMGADRTLMAWVRTALSMISFGFTIYKVLQGFQEHGGGLVKHD